MYVIGIAGGIACGKSLVAEYFRNLGAISLDVDGIGHDVLRLPDVMESIKEAFGDQVFDSDGNIDRKSLAKIVFERTENDQSDQLEILERITHPRIARIVDKQISDLRDCNEVPAVILDAPVMFKAGWDKFCDKIVFVDVPLEVRQERALANRNWSPDELVSRERRQVSVTVKRKKATDIIENTGTPRQLYEQVVRLWTQWGFRYENDEPSN